MTPSSSYTGGCHCGQVRFEVQIREWKAIDCNCSICRRKGFLHLIIPPSDFNLLSGADQLTRYQFNTDLAIHLFCQTCGIHAFYHPRSHPNDIDVNLWCLDAAANSTFVEQFEIQPFDGQRWEDSIEQLQ
jgi:hypothetical protein